MDVLLAIKPVFVNEIFKGSKIYEYRKTIFTQHINKVIVYASRPLSKVVGEFSIDTILVGTPEKIWQLTHQYGGISKHDYDQYFANKTKAYAIKIKHYQLYHKPIDLNYYHVKRAPQSFLYLK